MEKEYNKIIEFGKIDYNGTGKKENLVTLELELGYKNNEGFVFSAMGNVWNKYETDILMGGQCVDDIFNEYRNQLDNSELYFTILTLWEKYHLNDMHPDCIHQRAEKWGDVLINPDKPKTQDNMRAWQTYTSGNSKGLLGKPCEVCKYKYGTAWIYEPIPVNDLRKIVDIMGIDMMEQLEIIRKLKRDIVKDIQGGNNV